MCVGHFPLSFTEGKTSLPGVSLVCLSGFWWENPRRFWMCQEHKPKGAGGSDFEETKASVRVFSSELRSLACRVPFTAVTEADIPKAWRWWLVGPCWLRGCGAVTVFRAAGSRWYGNISLMASRKVQLKTMRRLWTKGYWIRKLTEADVQGFTYKQRGL